MSYFIGLMCGTSMDSIDAALIDFSARKPICLATYQQSLPERLKRQVLHLSICDIDTPAFGTLDIVYGELFSEAALGLLEQANVKSSAITAIGSHGQTVLHNPDARPGYSIQLGSIEVIAQKTGILTVGDFRNPDIRVGGQGAPLAPAFHRWCFHSSKMPRAIINLGGIANITWLPAQTDEPIFGWDIGPANAIIDALANRFLKQPFDQEGQWAASGKVHPTLLDALLLDPYFTRLPPKSTGKSLFNLDWLDKRLLQLDLDISAKDVQCTLTHLTAKLIANAIHSLSSQAEVVLCGGGVKNRFLWTVLEGYLGKNYVVISSDALGLSPQWVESACFAWLAHERVAGRCANSPSVTGASKSVLLGTFSTQHIKSGQAC